jgi:hypothetical protein
MNVLDTVLIVGVDSNTASVAGNRFMLGFHQGNICIDRYGQVKFLAKSGILYDNNWHHVAVVRSSGTMNFYFDGSAQGSGTADSTNYSGAAGTLRIGASGAYISDLNGYIDDLRITKGVARYTANFTPPTAAFPNE